MGQIKSWHTKISQTEKIYNVNSYTFPKLHYLRLWWAIRTCQADILLMARKGSGPTRFSTLKAWRATGRMKKKRLEIDEKNMCRKEKLEVFWFWKIRLVLLSFVVTLLLSFCSHSLSPSLALSLFGCEQDSGSSLTQPQRSRVKCKRLEYLTNPAKIFFFRCNY